MTNVRPPPLVLVLGTGTLTPIPPPFSQLPAASFSVVDQRHRSDGVAAARALRPDVVLVDVGRNPTQGLNLCRALQAEPETRAIPLIAITGDIDVGHFMMTMRVRVCDEQTLAHEINRLTA
jgi:CheY-like chemotaxis protein